MTLQKLYFMMCLGTITYLDGWMKLKYAKDGLIEDPQGATDTFIYN